MSHSLQYSLESWTVAMCVCVRERHTHSTDLEHKNVAQYKAHFEIGNVSSVFWETSQCVKEGDTHTDD